MLHFGLKGRAMQLLLLVPGRDTAAARIGCFEGIAKYVGAEHGISCPGRCDMNPQRHTSDNVSKVIPHPALHSEAKPDAKSKSKRPNKLKTIQTEVNKS